MKKCNDCKEMKDEGEFHKNQKVCKPCKSIRGKNAYANNKEDFLKRNVERRQKFKSILNERKSGQSCNRCGESHIGALDYHHKDPSIKEFTISHFVTHMYPSKKNIKRLDKEIKKCEVICSNCHRKEHWEQLNS